MCSNEDQIGSVTYFDYVSRDDSIAFNLQRQYVYYAVKMSDDYYSLFM